MGISGDLLNLMESFLSEWSQRVLLNGQSSEWDSIKAGDLSDGVSIFSAVHDINSSESNLSSDLWKISEWAFKW